MKKKIFYIIIAILQILIGIYLLINLNLLLETTMSSLSKSIAAYPQDTQGRIITLFNNHGKLYLGIISSIPILLNLIILKIAISNRIAKNKGVLIALSAICIFFSNHILGIAFSVISLIVSICIERKNPEDFPDKKEMPVIEYKKASKKEIILSIILVLVYFSQLGVSFIINKNTPAHLLIGIEVAYYIVLAILSILAFKDTFKRDFKLFKNNLKPYMKFIFTGYAIFIPIYFLLTIVSSLIVGSGVSKNQSSVDALPLLTSIPLAIIWAPLVEESIFRGSLRRFIKKDFVFIIVSGLIFGLIHTIKEDSLIKVFLMCVPYACMGTFMAYAYKKTNNIFTNIFIHFFINTVAMCVSILFLH